MESLTVPDVSEARPGSAPRPGIDSFQRMATTSRPQPRHAGVRAKNLWRLSCTRRLGDTSVLNRTCPVRLASELSPQALHRLPTGPSMMAKKPPGKPPSHRTDVRSQSGPPGRRYDVAMIRDFLDHPARPKDQPLPRSPASRTLSSRQLAHYIAKYGSPNSGVVRSRGWLSIRESQGRSVTILPGPYQTGPGRAGLSPPGGTPRAIAFDEAMRCAPSNPNAFPVVLKSQRRFASMTLEAEGFPAPDPIDYWPPIPEGYQSRILDRSRTSNCPRSASWSKLRRSVLGVVLSEKNHGKIAVFYGADALKKVADHSVEPYGRRGQSFSPGLRDVRVGVPCRRRQGLEGDRAVMGRTP